MSSSEITAEELQFLQEYQEYQKQNKIEFYKPHDKQLLFHKSEAIYRLLHGANRSGKTVAGAIEAVWYSTGLHPHKKIETPNDGWVISTNYDTQKVAAQKLILEYLPKRLIKKISYIKAEVINTIWVIPDGRPKSTPLEDCSKIVFKSGDSETEAFGGAALRWEWFDEEPDKRVWNECKARIGAGMPLDIWLTMTPIFEQKGKKVGMTWTHRELYQKKDGKRIDCVGVGIEDNTFLTKEQVEEQKKKYEGTPEYDIRIKGEFKLLAGNNVFNPDKLMDMREDIEDGAKCSLVHNGGKIDQLKNNRGYLTVFREPQRARRYAIGADIGLGVGGDPSCAIVFDMESLEQVAELHGQISPGDMGEELIKLGKYYNDAWIGVEANSFGIACIDVLKLAYSKLLFRYKEDKRTKQKTKQIGFYTDTKSKPMIISDFGKALNQDALLLHSEGLIDELSTYVIDERGSCNAETGCHDDRVMAAMIALYTRKHNYMNYPSSAPQPYSPTNPVTGY